MTLRQIRATPSLCFVVGLVAVGQHVFPDPLFGSPLRKNWRSRVAAVRHHVANMYYRRSHDFTVSRCDEVLNRDIFQFRFRRTGKSNFAQFVCGTRSHLIAKSICYVSYCKSTGGTCLFFRKSSTPNSRITQNVRRRNRMNPTKMAMRHQTPSLPHDSNDNCRGEPLDRTIQTQHDASHLRCLPRACHPASAKEPPMTESTLAQMMASESLTATTPVNNAKVAEERIA